MNDVYSPPEQLCLIWIGIRATDPLYFLLRRTASPSGFSESPDQAEDLPNSDRFVYRRGRLPPFEPFVPPSLQHPWHARLNASDRDERPEFGAGQRLHIAERQNSGMPLDAWKVRHHPF